jgi:multimeric flavodoxin WrbA
MRSYLFLSASSRLDGNTELLARHAAAALPAGTPQRWIRLADVPLPPFEDHRHSGDGRYPEPAGNERLLWEATLEATDLVIASPLYWYTLSASAKLYFDYWAGWMRVPGPDFRGAMRGKTMWAISAISEEDPAVAEPLIGTLRLSAQYLGMHWGGELLGYADRPGDMRADEKALGRAAELFA